jgi:hypothetical protein
MTSPLLAAGRTIIGVFLIGDRDLMLLILSVIACLTLATTLWWGRGRRWTDATLFGILTFFTLTFLAHLIFKYLVGVPMAKLDLIRMTADL